jgi:hypothetical protein
MRTCIETNCNNKHHARGLCLKHYGILNRIESKLKIAKRRKKYNKKNSQKRVEYARDYIRQVRKEKSDIYYKLVTRKKHQHAKRRAAKLKRIPKWITKEDLKQIELFISKCPETHHVDHYYPLQGEYVSGLHVLSNLCYLPIEINLKKNNKTPGIDWNIEPKANE